MLSLARIDRIIGTSRFSLCRNAYGLVLALLFSPGLAAVAAPPAAEPLPTVARIWAPELREAWVAYLTGDYSGAAAYCRQVLSREVPPALRHDAALLNALALLRMPTREDRLDGQAWLRRLTTDEPALAWDPECNLARGAAHLALHETADALDMLDRAAAAFTLQEQERRALAALVLLGQAWQQHNEWQTRLARFDTQRPSGPREADEFRNAQIDAVRARIRVWPTHELALAELDFALARYALETETNDPAALAELQRLASAPRLTGSYAEAALLLAWLRAQHGHAADAVALYDRVQAEAGPEHAAAARAALAELTQPQLVIDTPAQAPSTAPVTVQVAVRGFAEVTVEVRHVALDAWLASPQQRGNVDTLPIAGAVEASWTVSRPADAGAYDWWHAGAGATSLQVQPPVGSYVVLARGHTAEGREHIQRALLLVSDLSAACAIGARHGVVWVTPTGPLDAADLAHANVRFWMQRSFAPRPLKLQPSGVGVFELPPEAYLMTARGWLCLVEVGADVALVQGTLPPAPTAERPQLALVAGPTRLDVEAPLYVAGALTAGQGRTADQQTSHTLLLQFIDSLENVRLKQQVDLPAGATSFATVVRFPAELANKNLRLVPQLDDRPVAGLLPQVTVHLQSPAADGFRVRIDTPVHQPPHGAPPAGRVYAEYPWGAAPTYANVYLDLQSYTLPDTLEASPAPGLLYSIHDPLDAPGRFIFDFADFAAKVQPPPAAALLETVVRGLTRRTGRAVQTVLYSDAPTHAWFTANPARPTAGTPVHVQLNWFAPADRIVPETPTVTIRQADETVADLPLYAGANGLRSPAWIPSTAGDYTLRTRLTDLDGAPLDVQATLVVDAAPAAASAAPTLQVQATRVTEDDVTGVRVQMQGRCDTPWLALLTAADPRAAQTGTPFTTTADAFLPLPEGDAATTGLRVLVLTLSDAGLRLLAHVPVTAAPVSDMRLRAADSTPWPGTTVHVTLELPPELCTPGTVGLLRLIPAASSGWSTDATDVEDDEAAVPAIDVALAATGATVQMLPTRARSDPRQRLADFAPLALRTALCEGVTLWTRAFATAPTATFDVPLPAQPAAYKLIVAVRAPTGVTGERALILDARRGVDAELSVTDQLFVGDRTLVACRVQNPGTAERTLHVKIAMGETLTLVDVATRVARGPRTTSAPTDATTLTLPPDATAWVWATVEARSAGPFDVTVKITDAEQARRLSAVGTVQPVAVVSAGDLPTIERELWVPVLLDPRVLATLDPNDMPLAGRDSWSQLAADTPLTPGGVVLVRERLRLAAPQTPFIWRQAVPVTCQGVDRRSRLVLPLGLPAAAGPHELAFSIPALKAGVYTHEYLLSVDRPGVGVLPPPRWERGEAVETLPVSPLDTRIIVAE